MREAAANKYCADTLVKAFPNALYYKHNDRAAKGRPDSTFTWNRITSWLEFKMLEGHEDLHARGTHGLTRVQLMELIRLERAGAPAWVVAFREGTRQVERHTTIYRPSALITAAGTLTPRWLIPSNLEDILSDLKHSGVAARRGFDYTAVVHLIHQTHV